MDDQFAIAAEVLRSIALETPPNLGGGFIDILQAAKVANRFRKLSSKEPRDVIKLMTMSAADFLDQYLENDLVKSTVGFISVTGSMGGVTAAGSAYVLMHHYFGQTNGKKWFGVMP